MSASRFVLCETMPVRLRPTDRVWIGRAVSASSQPLFSTLPALTKRLLENPPDGADAAIRIASLVVCR